MNKLDLRPYAERLAKAMPERFTTSWKGPCWSGGPGWVLRDETPSTGQRIDEFNDSPADRWAFFGPLLDEFGARTVTRYNPHPESAELIHDTMLEAVAEAVCQAAESKAKEVGK